MSRSGPRESMVDSDVGLRGGRMDGERWLKEIVRKTEVLDLVHPNLSTFSTGALI